MLTNSYVDRTRGGVELHVYNLAKQMIRSGHTVTVCRTSPGPSTLAVDDVPLWVLQPTARGAEGRGSARQGPASFRFVSNFLSRLRVGLRARRLIDVETLSRDFDVVHHHDFITSAVISRRLAGRGLRQVWTNHLGEFLLIRRIPIVGRFLTKLMTRKFAAATGPSDELAESAAIACPVEFVPNGVDTGVYRPLSGGDKATLRGDLGLDADEFICIVPRRWAPSKGVVYAARALLEDGWPLQSRVLFIGAGESDYPEYASEVRQVLERTSVDYTVVDSVGPAEMARYLQAADVCIIPSLLEATSLSALEAMSVGLPVIATDVGGLPALVDESNGRIVRPRSAEALASSVSMISSAGPSARARMGVASRTRVESEFSWDVVAARIAQMYGDVR